MSYVDYRKTQTPQQQAMMRSRDMQSQAGGQTFRSPQSRPPQPMMNGMPNQFMPSSQPAQIIPQADQARMMQQNNAMNQARYSGAAPRPLANDPGANPMAFDYGPGAWNLPSPNIVGARLPPGIQSMLTSPYAGFHQGPQTGYGSPLMNRLLQ